jgi:hypothetical protein
MAPLSRFAASFGDLDFERVDSVHESGVDGEGVLAVVVVVSGVLECERAGAAAW